MARSRRGVPFRRPAAGALALLALAGRASAHERDFTLSRDWHLPYAGEHEIESRTFWDPKPNDVSQLFEYEYGITDHIAIEPGVKFLKPNADSFKLKMVECELRFNFRDFAFDTLLPAFNVEYEHRVGEEIEMDSVNPDFEAEKQAIELKGILSWYTQQGDDLTVNLNVGRVDGEDESEWESEATFGWLRKLDFIPGLESKDHPTGVGIEVLQQFSKDKFTEIGPVVSWRASKNLHVLVTALYAVNHRDVHSDELRLILEWEF
ncbi:MAG TPA: hypothetical protein VFG37_05620 [Planctomycetota bacterium]|nr:hypothetical protein [Planctomycetota bacterium]